MSAVKVDSFGGMLPAVDDRLLPDKSSAHSENTWLYSGRLSGIPQPSLIRACTAGTAKVFRLPNNYVDSKHLDDSVWMEFANADTDVIRALVISDTFDRYYWASSSAPPQYNTRARIAAGSNAWLLGIPSPALPGLAIVGGSASTMSRAYVTTWVSAYGEEGPPSPPVSATGHPDGSWNLTFTAADAGDLGTVGGNRYLTKTRIYRTITSTAGVATFFLVAEIAIATLAYSDVLTDPVVSANTQLQSTNWTAPPTDLAGWTTMPNGMIVGWRSNELWFCEPFRPHAWPAAYTVVVDFPIVGLGVTNQTLVVCTQGYPVTASGVHPSSVALSKSASLEPCLSRGSILSTTEGVYYASPNGLTFAGNGTLDNITRDLVTKDKWSQLVNATSLRAARIGTAYYAFGSKQPGVFDALSFDTLSFAQQDFTGAYAGLIVDPLNQRVAFNLLSDPSPVTSVQNDPWSGEIFIVKNDNLYRIDLTQTDPTRRVFKWRSKKFQAAHPRNFAAMKVYWLTPTAAAPDAVATAPMIQSLVEFPVLPAGTTYGVVRLYADDVLVLTRELVTSGELIRLPSGFKANYWQIEFETYVDILSVQMANSAKGLAAV